MYHPIAAVLTRRVACTCALLLALDSPARVSASCVERFSPDPIAKSLLHVAAFLQKVSPGIPAGILHDLNISGLPHSFELLYTPAASKAETPWQNSFKLLHIPKTGGTTLEAFLGVEFQYHEPLLMRPDYQQYRWITIVRNPMERLFSDYLFRLGGENQPTTYKERQREMCEQHTGRDYEVPCIPKISFYEYAIQNRSRNRMWTLVASSNPWKFPPCSTLSIWRQLLDHFWIVGTTERMKELELLVAAGLGVQHGSLNIRLNVGVAHEKADDVLSHAEAEALQEANVCDYLLYEAADQFLSQLLNDYSEQRLL